MYFLIAEPALLSQLQFAGNSVLGLLPAEEEDGLNASDKMTKVSRCLINSF